MTTNITRTLIAGFAAITLTAASAMAIEPASTNKVNDYVHTGVTTKSPNSLKKISKAQRSDAKAKAKPRKRAPRPVTMKPGQFARAIPAPATSDAPASMLAD